MFSKTKNLDSFVSPEVYWNLQVLPVWNPGGGASLSSPHLQSVVLIRFYPSSLIMKRSSDRFGWKAQIGFSVQNFEMIRSSVCRTLKRNTLFPPPPLLHSEPEPFWSGSVRPDRTAESVPSPSRGGRSAGGSAAAEEDEEGDSAEFWAVLTQFRSSAAAVRSRSSAHVTWPRWAGRWRWPRARWTSGFWTLRETRSESWGVSLWGEDSVTPARAWLWIVSHEIQFVHEKKKLRRARTWPGHGRVSVSGACRGRGVERKTLWFLKDINVFQNPL